MIKKIISGGQTGADRSALDFAIDNNIPHGGWIPKGRITEGGRLPEKYHLQEMETSSYDIRTEQNVIDSDGTVIVSHGKLTGGSALTQTFAIKHHKPCIHLNMNKTTIAEAAGSLNNWIEKSKIKILNVAGPRASKDDRIYQVTKDILEAAFIKDKDHGGKVIKYKENNYMAEKLDQRQTGNESEDDITELELEDDALEKKMRKLESDAERLLHHSNELLQELNKTRAKQEKAGQDDLELKNIG
jgi:hypothetical protein